MLLFLKKYYNPKISKVFVLKGNFDFCELINYLFFLFFIPNNFAVIGLFFSIFEAIFGVGFVELFFWLCNNLLL